jgi:hypothetical protein
MANEKIKELEPSTHVLVSIQLVVQPYVNIQVKEIGVNA